MQNSKSGILKNTANPGVAAGIIMNRQQGSVYGRNDDMRAQFPIQQAEFQDLSQQQPQWQYAFPTLHQAYYISGATGTRYQPINQIGAPSTNNRGMLVSGTNDPFYGKGDDFLGRGSGSISSKRRVDDDQYKRQVVLGIQSATGMPIGGSGGMGARSYLGFDILYNTQHIFIQPSESDFADLFSTPNLVGKFDILNTNGDRIYFATDVLGKGGNQCCGVSFAISIMSYDGSEVLTVTGDAAKFEMKSVLASPLLDKKRILGYVNEDERCCSTVTNYAIKDVPGNTCFRVIREPSNPNPTDYEIFGNNMINIGRLSKIWPSLPRRSQKLAHTYGVSFPLDMEIKEKAMMMGTVFGVYMKYYGDHKRDRRIARQAWCCGIFMAVLIAFIIVGIILVIFHTVRGW